MFPAKKMRNLKKKQTYEAACPLKNMWSREICTYLLTFSINFIALWERDGDDERWMFCDASSIWKGTRPEKSDLANWVTAFKGKSWNRFKKQSSARAILDGEHPSLEVNRIQHENWKLNQSRFSLLVVNGFICIYWGCLSQYMWSCKYELLDFWLFFVWKSDCSLAWTLLCFVKLWEVISPFNALPCLSLSGWFVDHHRNWNDITKII